MSAPLLNEDTRAYGVEFLRIAEAGLAPMTDRRRRARVALSLPVRVFRGDGTPLDSRTTNVSSEGFYCTLDAPLTVGERIRCVLSLPSLDPVYCDRSLALDCRARIVRIELLGPCSYGLGFLIEHYQVVHGDRERAAHTLP